MAMSRSTSDLSYIPMEEDVGTWVVVTAPESPESATDLADATTSSSSTPQYDNDEETLSDHLSNGDQTMESEGRKCSASLDEEGLDEGEDVVDMGLRIGDKPLQVEIRPTATNRRQGHRITGYSVGSRTSGLSSKASSVGETSDVTHLSDSNVSTPETRDINNSAGEKDINLQASKAPMLSNLKTSAAAGSHFSTHPEVLKPGSNSSASSWESDASDPCSPADKLLLEYTDLGPQHGAPGQDKVDKGVGFGIPVVQNKNPLSQNSQVENPECSIKISQSSNSLKGKRRHSSGKSFYSAASFRSERGSRSSRPTSKSMAERLRELFGRPSSEITNLERSLTTQMDKHPPEAGRGNDARASKNLLSSGTAECKEDIIVPVEAPSVSLRPRRGSDNEEEGEIDEELSHLASEVDEQKVEHWLEKTIATDDNRLDMVTLLCCLLSLGLYVADVGTDIKLAVEFLQRGHPVFGWGTMGIFLVTVFLNILVGLFFYSVEWQRAQAKARSYSSATTKSCATDTGVTEVDNLQSLLQHYFQDDHREEDGSGDAERSQLQDLVVDDEPQMLRSAMPDHRKKVSPAVCTDHQEGASAEVSSDCHEDGERSGIPGMLWIVRIAFTLVGLGPAWRICEALYHGWCTRRKGLSPEEMKYHYHCFRQDGVTLQLLQLLEGFLEAAPQLIWQLYIYLIQARRSNASTANLLSNSTSTVIYNVSSTSDTLPFYEGLHEQDDNREDDDVGVWQAITLSLSALSLAVAPSLYQRAMRKDSDNEMKWLAVGVYFTWRVCEVVPRVLCLALFASVFGAHIFIVTGIHWLVMLLWLHGQGVNIIGGQSGGDKALQPEDTGNHSGDGVDGGSGGKGDGAAVGEVEACPMNGTPADSQSTGNVPSVDVKYEVKSHQGNTKCLTVLNSVFLALLAHMLIFCHLNAKDGRTRFRALAYYILFYLENLVMGVLWYTMTPDLGTWYHGVGFTVVMAASFFHITLQLMYYRCCHPEKMHIPVCLNSSEIKNPLQCVKCVK